jgi:hypothetical protein
VQVPEAQVPLQHSLSAEHPLPTGRQHFPSTNGGMMMAGPHTAAGLQHGIIVALPPLPENPHTAPTAAQQLPSG